MISTHLAFVLSALAIGTATAASSDDNVVANKTCYYCGFENPCPLDFAKDEESVRVIKCTKSCLKFDGWTLDGSKRVLVRDCGYFSTTECRTGPLDRRQTATGSICHCVTDRCNSATPCDPYRPLQLLLSILLLHKLFK